MKKVVLIVIPVAILAVVGLGLTGKINIPGLTPKKALGSAQGNYGAKDSKLPPIKPVEKPKVAAIPPKVLPKPKVTIVKHNPEEGAGALAAVWNEMPVDDVLKVSTKWTDPDLAEILGQMDTAKVAQIISSMAKKSADRASKISQLIRDNAAIVKDPDNA